MGTHESESILAAAPLWGTFFFLFLWRRIIYRREQLQEVYEKGEMGGTDAPEATFFSGLAPT